MSSQFKVFSKVPKQWKCSILLDLTFRPHGSTFLVYLNFRLGPSPHQNQIVGRNLQIVVHCWAWLDTQNMYICTLPLQVSHITKARKVQLLDGETVLQNVNCNLVALGCERSSDCQSCSHSFSSFSFSILPPRL